MEFDPNYEANLRAKIVAGLIGQDHVIDPLVEMVMMHRVGLNPIGRPAGIAMLLGPTGTGKTLTLEMMAEAIHGSRTHILKIDCGEYQMDHEVAKLIGAPPGYLGHRETQPLLTQYRLSSVASDKSSLSIVLFDEVEKAAPSLNRLLLGILDKGSLRLGDNTSVSFENTLVCMTSNLGADKIEAAMNPYGYGQDVDKSTIDLRLKVESDYRKHFAPEFRNRIDHTIVYKKHSEDDLRKIFRLEVESILDLIMQRKVHSMEISYAPSVIDGIVRSAKVQQFGARSIKREVRKSILTQIARLYDANGLPRRVKLKMVDGDLVVSTER